MSRVALGVLLLGLGIRPAWGADPAIEAFLDPAACRVGEQVVLTVTISGESGSLPEPELPDMSADFDVGSAGSSRNMSIVNGRMSSSVTLRYALAPKREGTLVVPPIRVEVGGKTLQTGPLSLTVSRAPAPPAPPPSSPKERGATTGTEDIFVRATVDKTDPTVYEQVTYRVQLYTRLPLLESPGFTSPTTKGFWKESLPAIDPRTVQVGEGRYQMLEVAFAVFPTTPGKLTIGESVLQCTVEKPRTRNRQDPFRSLFNRVEGTRLTLRTDPITLDVKPLPPNAPEGYAGAVGDFRVEATVDRTQIAQDESVTLVLKVSGVGNLGTIDALSLPPMPEFRTYPSNQKRDDGAQGQKIGGTLTQQFVLVPLRAGRHVIPSVEIVTYSPSANAYRTLATQPIPLLVSAANVPASSETEGSRRDIEELGRDIRFIETEVPAFGADAGPWTGSRLWFSLLPIPAAAYAGVWLLEGRRRRLGSDVALRRRSRAARQARRALQEFRGGDPPAAAARVLQSYLADRYNLPTAGLTPDRIEERLRSDGVDPVPVTRFLADCDAARFAPGAPDGGRDWPAETRGWIDRLEKGT